MLNFIFNKKSKHLIHSKKLNKKFYTQIEFAIIFKLLSCIVVFGLFFYLYLGKQNELTKLRLEIPIINREIEDLREENNRLLYEIDKLENPEHLMNISKMPEFKHLENQSQDNFIEFKSCVKPLAKNDQKE